MEKRWTRKKRAAREAGELPAKPVLSRRRDVAKEGSPAKYVSDKDTATPETGQKSQPKPEVQIASAPEIGEQPKARKSVKARSAAATTVKARDSAPNPKMTAPAAAHSEAGPSDLWQSLRTFDIDERHLDRNRIITAARRDPAHAAFDVLRTKLLRVLRDNGWTRVAITSPTEGCGKTFMSVNLAISLSRQANCRTLLLDLDMRRPTLAKVLKLPAPESMSEFLRGNAATREFLCRPSGNTLKIGENVAFGGNSRREDYAAELLQQPETVEVMRRVETELKPNVMLFDMPPALVNDDVLAARPLYDGVILIVGGGITKPKEIRDVERRLGADTPLLGVVLNRSEGEAAQVYTY